MLPINFGRQVCGSLTESATREWLVTDGCGGFAMGTVAGLRTRRYHGLLIVATEPPGARRLGLASLDPVLVIGDRRIPLGTHEWASGAIEPAGYQHLTGFALDSGVPRWTWSVGAVTVEAELAMTHGRPAVGVCYRLTRAGSSPVRLELTALCTWRDVHGERRANGSPVVEPTADGFVFERAYRVRGPGFLASSDWYRDVYAREEAARGLNPVEDLWCAGTFSAALDLEAPVEIEAWAGDLADAPPSASQIITESRQRAGSLVSAAGATDPVSAQLVLAADQFIVAGANGPTVVAGYPWFGDWSRDTMTSYEGLFLDTGRHDEGRVLLRAAAASISDGMLANTADAGSTEYNTVDGSLWFLHAVGRHVERTGDVDLATELLPALVSMIDHHLAGTRFGIKITDDGLLTQGADGWALTWMDARVDGTPITARRGKPVEVNALWIRGLRVVTAMAGRAGGDAARFEHLADQATSSFVRRFARPDGGGLFDVIDGPEGDDASVRPNQLLAVSLPGESFVVPDMVLRAVEPLVTSIGLRSLSDTDPRYQPLHRGGPAQRDRAYHQGTVWPWLIGPYVDTLMLTKRAQPELLDGLIAHLGEWGLGSVSETADGAPPHAATGCPFQAWSVAELLRAHHKLIR